MGYRCEQCEEYFSSRSNLTSHLQKLHKHFKCLLCDQVENNAEGMLEHIRQTHSTLIFKQVENIMKSTIVRYQYQIVGIQSNFNAIFNERIEKEIVALVTEQFVTYPSFKMELVLGALYIKSIMNEVDELTMGYFHSDTFIASRASIEMAREDITESFDKISNNCEEFLDGKSGLHLVDLVSLDIVFSKNIVYKTN